MRFRKGKSGPEEALPGDRQPSAELDENTEKTMLGIVTEFAQECSARPHDIVGSTNSDRRVATARGLSALVGHNCLDLTPEQLAKYFRYRDPDSGIGLIRRGELTVTNNPHWRIRLRDISEQLGKDSTWVDRISR